MNIHQLRPSARPLEILLPDGSKTGIVLTIQGQDTRAFKEASKAFAANQLAKKDKTPDFNELEKQRIELACLCVIGWEGIEEPDENGNLFEVQYSKAKAKEYLSGDWAGFIIEQIEEFVTQRANFFVKAHTA